MKTFHVHVKVENLQESITFYNALFNQKPTVEKEDYAKWMLEDPRINYAISTASSDFGIEHLGMQSESEAELQEIYANMKQAKGTIKEEGKTTCCYSKSSKSWITDPQGVEWEAFYTFGTATIYGDRRKPVPGSKEAKETGQIGHSDETETETCCDSTTPHHQ